MFSAQVSCCYTISNYQRSRSEGKSIEPINEILTQKFYYKIRCQVTVGLEKKWRNLSILSDKEELYHVDNLARQLQFVQSQNQREGGKQEND